MVHRPPAFSVSPDPWLAGIVERDAYQVALDADGSTHPALFERLLTEPVFVTAKVATHNVAAVQRLEQQGFRIVDTSLVFGMLRNDGQRPENVRAARDVDRERVASISGSAFRYSRFHLDPGFPDALANSIKAQWAENYFSGQRGDAMWVIEKTSQVVGFVLLLRRNDEEFIIDLVAVSPECTRQGFGRQLVAAAISHECSGERGRSTVVVGTQAANHSSVNLYESMGFRLKSSQYVLHHHGSHVIASNGMENT